MRSCFAVLLLGALVFRCSSATPPDWDFVFTDSFDQYADGTKQPSLDDSGGQAVWDAFGYIATRKGSQCGGNYPNTNKCIHFQYWNGPPSERDPITQRYIASITTEQSFNVAASQQCVLSVDVRAVRTENGLHTVNFKFGTTDFSGPVSFSQNQGFLSKTFTFQTTAASTSKLSIYSEAATASGGIQVDNVDFRCGDGCASGYGFDVVSKTCVKCTAGLYSQGYWDACASCDDPAGRAQGTWEWAVTTAGNSDRASCAFHPTTRAGCISADNKACEWIHYEEAKGFGEASAACQASADGAGLASVTDDETDAFTAFLQSNSIASPVWVSDCGSECTGTPGYVCERPLDVAFEDSFSSDGTEARKLYDLSKDMVQELAHWNLTATTIDLVKNGFCGGSNFCLDLQGDHGSNGQWNPKSTIETKQEFAVEDGQPCVLNVDLKGGGYGDAKVTFKLGSYSSGEVLVNKDVVWHTQTFAFTVSGNSVSALIIDQVSNKDNNGAHLDNVDLSCPSRCAVGYGLESDACVKCIEGVFSPGDWTGCLACSDPAGQDSGTWEWGNSTANSNSSLCEWMCAPEWFYDLDDEKCLACGATCTAGLNESIACTPTTNRSCDICGAGYLCEDGVPEPCDTVEGFYCPEGYVPEGARRSGNGDLGGIPCPAGHYCEGGTADKVECESAEGFYCPAQFKPNASSLEEGLAGKACPPGRYCDGRTAQPEVLPARCDLVQACGDVTVANETCSVAQSTFYKHNDPPASFAVDVDGSTCMKTASATTDSNQQWVRVGLEQERLVATVRFLSEGAASDFEVQVNAKDFVPVTNGNGDVVENPSVGGAIPTPFESCVVQALGEGVFEAACAPATKGEFIFILRARASEELEVCGIEVFSHQCLHVPEEEEVSCGLGFQPSPCTEQCAGCVPCPPGTYSDKVGDYQCTACPGHTVYGEMLYSPEGSTSVFQCEGDAVLDGTSTLEVDTVEFNQTIDSWEIVVEYEIAPRIQINGVSSFFMSKGGVASPANDGTFQSKNFPCRADTSRDANSDVSAKLEETVCCLQDMRQDYLMTEIFRAYTDGLDLVAANDVCDSMWGSDELVNADLDEVGEEGTFFVDTDGMAFSNSITMETVPCSSSPSVTITGDRRSHESYIGKQCAKITIPDAELFKISKTLNPDRNLTDSRELFIGLLDLLPTGTRVVDSSSQQVSVVLTRTQYGTFAAYGEQNIDYDFISFLNARVHEVIDQSDGSRRGLHGNQYYAEVTFVYDDRLQPAVSEGAVVVNSVTLQVGDDPIETPCGTDSSAAVLDSDFEAVVNNQTCGPQDLEWVIEVCPQLSIPDDHFGRLYIPLDGVPTATVHIVFKLWFKDTDGKNDTLTLAMDLAVENFVNWCDADSGSVNLAERVIPRIIVGTESSSPQRLTGKDAVNSVIPFSTEAETLQDGMITLILDLNETDGLDDNLEVFLEDVIVIHVNPGSQPTFAQIQAGLTTGADPKYLPTYTYDPDSRDAKLHIPEDLIEDCPEVDFTESFFGCVHKHILKEEEITNIDNAYFVGSSPPPADGAQVFVETMLGDGTASVSARELGRDYESYLMTDEDVTGTNRKSIGLWINPGHKWGQTVHNSEVSLSKHVIMFVLFGVRSGVDGTERRMLLQASADGTGATSLVTTLEYKVNAATLVESVLDNVVAIEVEARLALSADEACLPQADLLTMCSERLKAAVAPHASKVERVECVSVVVENANCDGTRRAASAPVAVVDAVIALAESAHAFLDVDAVVASGSVLAIKQTAGNTLQTPPLNTQVERTPAPPDETRASGTNSIVIGAAAGAAGGVVVLALAVWQAGKRCKRPAQPLTEVVAAGVVQRAGGGMTKEALEDMLFTGGGGSHKQLLPAQSQPEGSDSV